MVKWELGLTGFCPGKMGFTSLGMGFSHWEWDSATGNGIQPLEMGIFFSKFCQWEMEFEHREVGFRKRKKKVKNKQR